MANVKSQAPVRGRASGRMSPQTHVPFYEGLIVAMSCDVALSCNRSDTELSRDLVEIQCRLRCEGMPFLTKTLPSLGKALDRALSSGTALSFTGFKASRNEKLPLFMGDLFKQVFDADGLERSDASPQAVMAIRQVTYLFYKLNLPFTSEQEDRVVNEFLEADESLSDIALSLRSTPYRRWIISEASSLIKRVLAPVDPLDERNFQPRHGPGAVSTGERPWEKPTFTRFIHRLAGVFPYERYFYYSLTHFCDDLDQFLALEELDAGTAKVVLVPKDSRGPRLISCEPLENQWIQQGLMNAMVNTIETHELTAGFVNFADQTVNQLLALDASLTGTRVTLDMKEASDRVSLALVKALFPTNWFDALFACRSDSTVLPDGRKVYLNKFAPMGSAVCFPVEALVFWALSTAAISYELAKIGSPWKGANRGVFVYGDDIICCTQDYECIMQCLPQFGLLLNMDKCCVARSFRESCGTDAYKGVVVTPLRVRATWSSSLADTDYLSWVAFHNAANNKGLFGVCDYLAEEIQRVRKTPYADVETSEAIALVDCRKMAAQMNRSMKFHVRWNAKRSRMEIRSWTVRARLTKASVPGWEEMQRVASLSPVGRYRHIEDTLRGLLARRLLAPDSDPRLFIPLWENWVEDSTVRAYQYPASRRVSLTRDWTSVY